MYNLWELVLIKEEEMYRISVRLWILRRCFLSAILLYLRGATPLITCFSLNFFVRLQRKTEPEPLYASWKREGGREREGGEGAGCLLNTATLNARLLSLCFVNAWCLIYINYNLWSTHEQELQKIVYSSYWSMVLVSILFFCQIVIVLNKWWFFVWESMANMMPLIWFIK